MIISAKVINHPRKIRDCVVCTLPMNFRQVRIYGAAERSDPPYVIYTHVHCATWDKEIVRKLQAVEQSVQRTCANCGASDWVTAGFPVSREYCKKCGASR
jgi:hypothetical protein